MIRTGKKFSKPAMSRVINGDTELKSEPEKAEKIRLDILMAEIYKSYNRSTLQKFIESGFVTVDGKTVKKSNQKFERGVKIDLKIPQIMKNADLEPKVLYNDGNVVVVDKPSGLLSEAKGEYCPERTLADFGLVAHRLDRDTSGVMILAKNEETQKFLKKQFQARTVHKTYYAIVTGRPKLDEAKIDLPMIRDMKRPTTFRVDANGKEADTYYRVVKTDDKHSLVELKPRTGRTHQLRVHMKYLGHPIVGDRVYEGEPADRLMLHAAELEITLPGGVRKVFKAKLPAEFEDFWQNDMVDSAYENADLTEVE
jgi:23S rRNA pseudouridine1911/1915/1917 synthase